MAFWTRFIQQIEQKRALRRRGPVALRSGWTDTTVEILEARMCLTTFTVNVATDVGGLDPAQFMSGVGALGTGDLRYAIAQAESNPGADVIVFDLPDNTSIVLTEAMRPITDQAGLSIAGETATNLTISGDANTNVTSDAADVRIFFVTNSAELQISGLTLYGGRAEGGAGGGGGSGGGGGAGMGGALLIDSGSVSLVNVSLFGNRAIGGQGGNSTAGGYGGGGGGAGGNGGSGLGGGGGFLGNGGSSPSAGGGGGGGFLGNGGAGGFAGGNGSAGQSIGGGGGGGSADLMAGGTGGAGASGGGAGADFASFENGAGGGGGSVGFVTSSSGSAGVLKVGGAGGFGGGGGASGNGGVAGAGGDYGGGGGVQNGTTPGAAGGFGGGGGGHATTQSGTGGAGGYGGGGGGGSAFAGSVGGAGGTFAGNGGFGNNGGTNAAGGGGAGLGGAIFVRSGELHMTNVSFSFNYAIGGAAGDVTPVSGGTAGQGKGGAIFVMPGATADYTGAPPAYILNIAPQNLEQPGDTADVYGLVVLGVPANVISVSQIADGAEPATNGKFRVTQATVAATDTVISYTIGGTATSGALNDYTPLTGTVTILAGQTTADIDVEVLNDNLVEPTETVIVTLTAITSGDAGTGVDSTNSTASLNIVDDDVATISIAQVNDAAEPATAGKFRITQARVSSTDTVVSYSTGGTATPGLVDDYLPLTGTATILAGQTSVDIDVLVQNDNLLEPTETVTVTLTTITSSDPQITINSGGQAASLDITDDDTALLSIAEINGAAESGINGLFRVTLTNASSTDTVVSYSIGGTATPGAGNDYTTLSGSVTIPAGLLTADIAMGVLDDALVEPTETVTLTLTSITSGDAGITIAPLAQTAAIVIIDNDVATISLTVINDGSEPATNGKFRVTQTLASATDTVISYVVGGTATPGAGNDYTALSGTVTILAGQTTADIDIAVLDDNVLEPTETVLVTLTTITSSDPEITINGSQSGTLQILDEDTATISIAQITHGDESGINGVFRVTQSQLSTTDTIISYLIEGSATPGLGNDYATLSGTVTIPAGQTTADIVVAVLDDSRVESTETVVVTLTAITSGDTGVAINGDQSASLNIVDDDAAVFTISNVIVSESDGTLVFNLVSDKALDTDVTISVTFTDGTATGGGTDYVSTTQQIVFLAGEMARQISVSIADDVVVETTESFTVGLGTVTALGDRSLDLSDIATGTITDNDAAVFLISDAVLGENNGSLVFNVTTDKPLDIDLIINVTFTDITATGGGTDYTSTTQQITFLAGETVKQVNVLLNNDSLVEATETFTAALSIATVIEGRSVVAIDTATGTIIDNDFGAVSIANVTNGAEGTGPTNGRFRITQTAASSTDTVVTYSVSGTALPGIGQDYSTLTGTATILAGQTSVDIDVLVLNDLLVESSETVIVTLTGLASHAEAIILTESSAGLTASVFITSDDLPTVTSVNSVSVAENTPISTVILDVNTDVTLIAPGRSVSYSLSGSDAAAFQINSVTGEVTFVAVPDFDTPVDQDLNNVYQFTVITTVDTDPTSVTTQDVTITVTGVNDSTPTFENASPTFSVEENAVAGTVVGSVVATDGDSPAQPLIYSIIDGNESGAFAINSATGEITVADQSQLDFELVSSFTLTIHVTDNGDPAQTANAVAVINLTDLEEEPTITIPFPLGTYHMGKVPAFVSPDATFTYDAVAVPNFEGSIFTTSITEGRSRRDTLKVYPHGKSNGGIYTKGRRVFFGSTQIGTFEGGRGNKSDLAITLNGNATKEAVDDLVRHVSFRARDKIGTDRVVEMHITDVEGVEGNTASRRIAVVAT